MILPIVSYFLIGFCVSILFEYTDIIQWMKSARYVADIRHFDPFVLFFTMIFWPAIVFLCIIYIVGKLIYIVGVLINKIAKFFVDLHK